jgi:hypothetical protein
LADAECGLRHFEAAAVNRADLAILGKKVERRPFADDDSQPTMVEIKLANGVTDREAVLWAAGSKAKPFTTAQYWEKFDLCTASFANAEAIRAAVAQLPKLAKARTLTMALSG